MGLFALGTWWLVRSTPEPVQVVSDRPIRHEADYFLRNFAIKTFDTQGRLKTELFGADARHFPDTDTLEIGTVRTRSFNEEGRMTVATADQALSNGDGSEVQLHGNVHVMRNAISGAAAPGHAPIEYRSEFLHAFSKAEKLKTHLPVVITQGANRFSGNSMSYDNIGAIIEMEGQVRGLLIPAKRD
jgi:lipopolysaccharide export system protein LptC